ncbi:MAG: helix-turn-helix domain-containing protein, partial [Clostridia bacterium]|nr:helix-turn-helix domain-containing protein [Clostridia bacterium]
MTTGQKIYERRKKAGMTQEELADKLGVSRQAVSKWESDVAFPETEKILELCKMFDLSADELLFGETRTGGNERDTVSAPASEDGKGTTWGKIAHEGAFRYEYVSKTRLFGMPLLHINFGFGVYRAKGVFALGNIATGLFSYGFLSLGLISAGFLSLGLLAFGGIALGLLFGAGGVATGALAFGGVAIGIMTFGGLSIGYVSIGGAAIGQFAMGGWAQGWLAVGNSRAFGEHAFVVPRQIEELERFIDANTSLGWLCGLIKNVAGTLY